MNAPAARAPEPGGSWPEASDGFCPALMMEVELTRPLPAVSHDGRHRRAWVLARLHGEPVCSCAIGLDEAGLTGRQLGALLWPALRDAVTGRFAEAGLPRPGTLTGEGLTADPARWPFLLRRRVVLAEAPFISVVICTRVRPGRL